MRKETITRDIYDDLQIRFDDLQAKYHELVGEMLKRNPPPLQPIDIDYGEALPDQFPVPEEVKEAIHTYSEPDSVEAAQVQEASFGMLRQGMPEEAVIAAIHSGEQPD